MIRKEEEERSKMMMRILDFPGWSRPHRAGPVSAAPNDRLTLASIAGRTGGPVNPTPIWRIAT